MHGGPSQFDTFTPKIDGPAHARSITGQVGTTIPGVSFSATFGELAKRAHLLNVVRSFVTGDGNHDIKPVLGEATLKANMGSLYSRVAGVVRPGTAMPTNVALFPQAVLPAAQPAITQFGDFASAGEFGGGYAPLVPGGGGGFQEDMRLPLPQERLGDRRALLAALDRGRRSLDGPMLRDAAAGLGPGADPGPRRHDHALAARPGRGAAHRRRPEEPPGSARPGPADPGPGVAARRPDRAAGPGRARKYTRPGAKGGGLSPCRFLDRLADLVPAPR